MSSKSKRRVTVDTSNAVPEDSEKRKPSVFERLGPGGGPHSGSGKQLKCRTFLMTGACSYGATCKFKHVHLRKSKSSRDSEGSPEEVRPKFKTQQPDHSGDKFQKEDEPESPDMHGKSVSASSSGSHSRRDKETKVKSQVVVKKSSGNQGSDESDASNDDNWFQSLDYKKELELEQKRQQLQRELSRLSEQEIENITIQKEVQSGSDSSPDHPKIGWRAGVAGSGKFEPLAEGKLIESPMGKKKEKKKHRTRSPPEVDSPIKERKMYITSPPPLAPTTSLSPSPSQPLSMEKTKEHKKSRHDVEEEGWHKKHRKHSKKEKKRSISPQLDVARSKKKERNRDEAEPDFSRSASYGRPSSPVSHSKRSKSVSSRDSPSPQRTKSAKLKVKTKKKKGHSGKGDAPEISAKSKKFSLSPLKKTLKLKKVKSSSSVAELKEMIEDDEAARRRSPTPQPSRRSLSREFLEEDPIPSSRYRESVKNWDSSQQQRGRSMEKRSKKHKNKHSQSPGTASSERTASRSRKRDSREMSRDSKRHGNELQVEKDVRKGGVDDRRKRVASSPTQAEMYSPSQLEYDLPESSSKLRPGDRQGERSLLHEDSRRLEKDIRRDRDRLEGRPKTPPIEHPSVDRYGRRSGGEGIEAYAQDRGAFSSERTRSEVQVQERDREQRVAVLDRYDRNRSRAVAGSRDQSFDRQQDKTRGNGGRDPSRDGRENVRGDPVLDSSRVKARSDRGEHGDSRDVRDRDSGRIGNFEGGRFPGGSFPAGSQKRRSGGGQWEQEARGPDWDDRSNSSGTYIREAGRLEDRGRDVRGLAPVSSRLIPDEARDIGRGVRRRDFEDPRQPPFDPSSTDRIESLMDIRGSMRGDARDDRLDRGDRNSDRNDTRLDRGGGRGVEGRMDNRRSDTRTPTFEQRGFKPGLSEDRGGLRGVGDRSTADNFEFERRSGSTRDGQMSRAVERDAINVGSMSRDRYSHVEPSSGSRPARDDRGSRETFPDPNLPRDRRIESTDRYGPPDIRDLHDHRVRGMSPPDAKLTREGRAMDEIRLDEQRLALGRDRGLRGRGMYEFDSESRLAADLHEVDRSQRRDLLAAFDVPRRNSNRTDPLDDHEPPRGSRDLTRDDRGRRDREADLGPDSERTSAPGRMWDSSKDLSRDSAKESQRESGRDSLRDGRRDIILPSTVVPGFDRIRESDKDKEARRQDHSPRPDPSVQRWSPSDKSRSERTRVGALQSDSSRRIPDKKELEIRQGADFDKLKEKERRKDDADARSVRSADGAKDVPSPRSRKDLQDMGKGSMEYRDKDASSEGRRSPGRSRRKSKSPVLPTRSASADRSQLKRTGSLSPKHSLAAAQLVEDKLQSSSSRPSLPHSPSSKSRGLDAESSASKTSRKARSRTPVGIKRKREGSSRSPVPPGVSNVKDDIRSPVAKRLRESSRSPGRPVSRNPSPTGSQHSRSSRSSRDRRWRPGSSHKDDGRYTLQPMDRVAHVQKQEAEYARDESRSTDSRKRGLSPPWIPSPVTSDRSSKRRRDGEINDADLLAQDESKQGTTRFSGDGDLITTYEPKIDVSEAALPDSVKALQDNSLTDAATSKSGWRPRSSSICSRGSHGDEAFNRGLRDIKADQLDDSQNRADSVANASDLKADFMGGQDGADDNKDAGLSSMLQQHVGYEEISSDESDFAAEDGEKAEKQQVQSIVSILDIDWASLTKEPPTKLTTGSVLKQFHPANIFRRIGVSQTFAGDALFEKVKAICDQGLKEDTKRKEEVSENCESKEAGEKSSPESKDTDVKEDTSLLSDVPVLHMAAVRQKRERANLLRNLGPFRRALCARRDLEIRRQLCKVDKVYEQPAVFPAHVMDSDLCKLSIQLFRQGRDFSERKDSECDSKMDLI